MLLAVFCSCTQHPQDALAEDGALKPNESGTQNTYTATDSIQVAALFKKGDSLYNMDELDAALVLANQALETSQKSGYKRGVAGANYRVGELYLVMGRLTESIKAIDEALAYYVETNNQERMANLHNLKGNAYTDQGNKPEALNEYLTALKFYEAIGDKEGIAICHGNLGNINADMGRNDEAIREYETVLQISLEMGYTRLASMTYNNLGTIYATQKNLPEALKQHELSLKIKQETGDKRGQGIAYGNIGSVYVDMGKYEEGLKLHLQALKLSEEAGDNDNAAQSLSNIGWAKIKLGQAQEAKEWITKGLQLAKALGSKETIVACYNRLYEADSAMGNYKGAFEYNKIFNAYQDSLVNEENIKRTLESKFEYDFDKKEAARKAEQEKKDAIAAQELQKQKLVRNIFVGGFGVVFIFALIFFRQRNKISKERKRSDELLLNILPKETADELKAKGSADAKQFDEVTVMFTDFKNFTQASENLTASELVKEIHDCYSAFDKIISKHNLEKIKTIGDSYMCAGGLPVANATNAEDTVRAALEIRDFLEQEKQKRMAEGKPYFEIRIGCHTGPVVAGIVGIKKFAYDIWGDTVNIASRMESSGEAGKINISEATFELVKDKFNCTHRGKIEAKGKGEINMYFVESMR
jgi:class 3 adenylate cyclase/predicted negative regulator of RcsB-dependent stress response